MKPTLNRRDFLRNLVLLGISGLAVGTLLPKIMKKKESGLLWQINPDKCIQCGRCATDCVLEQSAVKAFHSFPICGYCRLCGGYFQPDAPRLDTGAENQLCPTGALKRKFIEEPYYEYSIDERLCIACGRCAKGCTDFGNGSLYLQVRQDLCLKCNECSIAKVCPSGAFVRVSSESPYLIKGRDEQKS